MNHELWGLVIFAFCVGYSLGAMSCITAVVYTYTQYRRIRRKNELLMKRTEWGKEHLP